MPPWLFRHDDLIKVLASASLLEKKKLTNTLNYIHFLGGHIHVLMKHPLYEESVMVRAYLEPCMGEELTCRWDQAYGGYNLGRYLFQYLIVNHDQAVIVVPAEVLISGSEELTLRLPEKSHIISDRQVARFICHDVNAELWQNGFQATGELIDFSPHAFRVRVQPAPPSSFHWFNTETPSTVRLSNGREAFYSGNCTCLQQKQTGRSREIVLAPIHDQINRFPAKVLRNRRLQPSPPFNALFEHPFSKKKIQREIFDISTSGIAICDKSAEVVLIPGMIIPELSIVYAGILRIQCKAQVIYSKEECEQVRFGIAILDMDLTNYNVLNQVLNNINGANAAAFNEVDLDELWEFFFDTDFIYPQKYKIVQSFKDDFRHVYRRLYEEANEIAKHFTYQNKGRIYGHVSLLRTYERTWMGHHLAARPKGGKPIGLAVMKQMLYYLNDVRRLPSANMDYIINYFSPGNKFPEHLFGGFTTEEGNPQHCSLDRFSYLTLPVGISSGELPRGWSLRKCSSSDFWEFEQFYRNRSGGLFYSILMPERLPNKESLEEVYARIGFLRRWKTFALMYLGELKAFIVLEESDTGINLSNLLSGFKVFVMTPHLPPDILFTAVSELSRDNDTESVPLLIYPDDYAHMESIMRENKKYYLWILDVQFLDKYLEYVKRKFRIMFG